MKKYELLDNDTIEVEGITLYRIRALRDFGKVKRGDLGGYIEGEHNLAQWGNVWVGYNDKIWGNTRISLDLSFWGTAEVPDQARILGGAKVGEQLREQEWG